VSAHELDDFLRELGEVEPSGALALEVLAEGLTPLTAPPDLRARILGNLGARSRFEHFTAQVAELLDLALEAARAVLARVDDSAAWTPELPGISFLWVEGGRLVANAVRGFVRVQAGLEFPEHEHFGVEYTLVLQGGFEDRERGRVFRPGDIDRMGEGTSHGFRALPGGTDLLKLAVVQKGLCALGQRYLPR
jgi:hypothetical protein